MIEMNWNLTLLDPDIKVDEYIYCVKDSPPPYMRSRIETKWALEHLSKKVVAVCPFCGFQNRYRFDLCTMKFWGFDREHVILCTPLVQEKPEGELFNYCEHTALLDVFFHFNGIEPYPQPPEGATKRSDFGPEVPGVMKEYLDAGLGMKAVISRLPVCRIENKKFVPRHYAYVISYFISLQNKNIDFRKMGVLNKKMLFEKIIGVHSRVESYSRPGFIIRKVDFNLEPYVKRGDLYWMDSDNVKKCFTSDLGSFPFKGINGRREDIDFDSLDLAGHGIYEEE